MSIKYFDICDTPFVRDSEIGDVKILRSTQNGVIEDTPTEYESDKFDRNWFNSREIDKETAYELAKNPGLSY